MDRHTDGEKVNLEYMMPVLAQSFCACVLCMCVCVRACVFVCL